MMVPYLFHRKFFSLFAFLLFQNRELQIMRKLDHCNIVRLRYFFYSSGEKVRMKNEGMCPGNWGIPRLSECLETEM